MVFNSTQVVTEIQGARKKDQQDTTIIGVVLYHIIYYIISYHIISYYIILYHIILYYIISYYIISYYIWYYIIWYYIIFTCLSNSNIHRNHPSRELFWQHILRKKIMVKMSQHIKHQFDLEFLLFLLLSIVYNHIMARFTQKKSGCTKSLIQ